MYRQLLKGETSMNKHLVSISAAIAVATAGGLAFAQATDSSAQAANANGVPGVEANVGANAKNDGGLPGVEMNIGADGDQKNIGKNSATDTSKLGAGPATTDMNSGSSTTMQPRVDRN
jgi:hypothetical protein